MISNDPLFQDQWYLLNTGQTGGTPGVDINVVGAWDDGATGEGVTVVVNDTGIDYTNPDIAPNFDGTTSASLDPAPAGGGNAAYYPYNTIGFTDSEDIALLAHGTSVTGLIAAADNGSGLMGVAFDATVSAFRIIDTVANADNVWTTTAAAFQNEITQNFDVANNSWGFPEALTDSVFSSGAETALAELRDAAVEGRDGLGIINVFAAGNGYADGDDTNLHAFQSSINVITVASVDDTGTVGVHDSTYDTERFSTAGTSILVSAPGVDMAVDDIVGSAGWSSLAGDADLGVAVTATASGDQVFGLDGTSFAAPLVTGIVALMLQVNPRLGLRDVQEILAYTARQTDPTDSTWLDNDGDNWNGGGLHVSRDYGFGLLDATAAVALAQNWPLQLTAANETLDTVSFTPTNDFFGSDGTSFTFSVGTSDDLSLDFVRLDLDLNYGSFENLKIVLTSPGGTASVLLDGPDDGLGSVSAALTPLQLTSDQFWDETAEGTWTVSIGGVGGEANAGQVVSASLILIGDPISTNPLYVYTNEYASEVASDPTRDVLTAPSGDAITLDVAAISGSNVVDLVPGSVSTIDGAPLTLGTSTTVGTVIGGQGNDTFIAGTGSESVIGGGGIDTVDLSGPLASYTLTRAGGNNGTIIGDGQDAAVTDIHWLDFSNDRMPLDDAAAATDFYGGGTSDILWQNNSTGQLALWDMQDGSAVSYTTFATAPADWAIAGIGDFYGTGDSSILWVNSSTDQAAIWQMSGSAPVSYAFLETVPNGWQVAGVGDFDGDGDADILWRNPATTQVAIREMNGASVADAAVIGTAASTWKVGGVADFNGEGDADILWQNTATGQVAIWDMQGLDPVAYSDIGTAPSGWQIAGVGDFAGNGTTDILWQNTSTAQLAVWQTNGTSVSYGSIVDNVPYSSGWQIAGIGDYYGSGKDDILWQNNSIGQIAIWQMNGTTVAGDSTISGVPSGWHPAHNAVLAA